MQLGELAHRSGVSVARVKLYLREGLLPPGRLRNATRAQYDASHLARLRMIDDLRQEGLSLNEIRRLTESLANPGMPLELVLAEAQTIAVGAPDPDASWPGLAALMARQGWPSLPTDASRTVETEAVRILNLGFDLPDEILDGYARAAELVASVEIKGLEQADSADAAVAAAVQGIRRYNRLLIALVALARTSHYLRGIGSPSEAADPG